MKMSQTRASLIGVLGELERSLMTAHPCRCEGAPVTGCGRKLKLIGQQVPYARNLIEQGESMLCGHEPL
jgi:hypothetical protein